MNFMKKAAVCGTLVCAMTASLLSGCGKRVNGTAAALMVNGESLNVGTANFYLRYQQAETAALFASYGLTDGSVLWDTDISGSDEDTSGESDSSSASSKASSSDASSASDTASSDASSASSASSAEEEKQYDTYGDQFKDSVLDTIERMMVMRQHMTDFGLAITEEQQAQINETAAKVYEANKDVVGALGATEADVNQVIELMSYEYIMREAMLEDMDREVSDEEAAQTTFTYARFSTKTDDEESGERRDMTEEEKEAVVAKAEELIREVKEADDIAEADIYSLATDLDENCTSIQASFGSDDTIYPDEVKDALATLKDGELYDGTIDTGDYIYVVRLDKEFDEEMTESKKASILSTRENEHITDKTQTWLDESEIEVLDGWNALKVTDSDPYTVKDETAGETESTSEETDSVSVETESE